MDQTIDYTIHVLEQLKEQASNKGIEMEISRQRGDGHHLFEFMGKVGCHLAFVFVDAVVRYLTRLLFSVSSSSSLCVAFRKCGRNT